jgi:iron complex outermembrane recepter protein
MPHPFSKHPEYRRFRRASGWMLLALVHAGLLTDARAQEAAVGYSIAPDGTIIFDAPQEAPAAATDDPPADDPVVDNPVAGSSTADSEAAPDSEAGPGETGYSVDDDGTFVFDTLPEEAPEDAARAEESDREAAQDEALADEGSAAPAEVNDDPAVVDAAVEAPAEGENLLEEIEVFGARPRLLTPLPGVLIEEGTASSNIQSSTGEEIRDSGALTATQFLSERMQSVTVRDTTGNPFQQELVFRGFTASPIAATPQGLSVYLDGVRVNEPFGQVVNWDLIPLNAIDTLALVPGSNPLFGLNTIGGAVSLTTKSGFTSPGLDASQTVGSFGRFQTQMTAGASDEHVAGLISFNRLFEDGWRRNSPSDVKQAFARADVRNDRASLTVQGLRADTSLFGGGVIPEEDAARDPRSVYTAPDGTENELTHLWTNLKVDITDTFSASALAYQRRSNQSTTNGDFWDDWIEAGAGRVTPCTTSPNDIDRPPSINGAISDTPGISGCIPNGVLNQGLTQQDTLGAALQLNWVTERNQLVLGATWDKDTSFFQQTELIGDIDESRNVVIDPNREFQDGPLAASVNDFINLFPSTQAAIDFLTLLGSPAALDFIPIVQTFDEFGFLPISSVLNATGEPILRNRVFGNNETTAAFFYDIFSVTPKLNISLGARWSITRVQARTENDRPIPLYQFTPGFRPTFTGECNPGDGGNAGDFLTCIEEPVYEYQAFNPAAGFAWQFTDAFGLFGNVSRGSRTPSAIELACANPSPEFLRDFLETTGQGLYVGCTIPAALGNDPFLEQVRSTTYEFGGRGALTGIADWNLTAYQTDNRNDILFIALGIANRGVFDNFGRTRRRGIELGLSGERQRMNWFLNYSWVEATFQSRARILNLSNSSSAKRTLTDGSGTLEGEFFVDSGDVIPGVPAHSLRIGASFDVTPRFRVGLQAIGQTFAFSRGNENNLHQPGGSDRAQPLRPGEPPNLLTRRDTEYVGEGRTEGFAVFNLDANYRFTDRLSAFLRFDNIFDQRFNTGGQLGLNAFPSVFPSGPPEGVFDPSGFSNNSNDWTHSNFVGPGAPRAVFLGLRWSTN